MYRKADGKTIYCLSAGNEFTRCGRSLEDPIMIISIKDASTVAHIVLCVDCVANIGKKWKNGTHKKLRTPSFYGKAFL